MNHLGKVSQTKNECINKRIILIFFVFLFICGINAYSQSDPVLALIGSQSVNEGVNLNFLISASDPDGPLPLLSISNIPAGASFSDNMDGTSTFDWTPDFTQAGLYYVTFKATDTAGAMAVDSEIVDITVIDSNSPPVLALIGAQSVNEGVNLTISISASDPNGTLPLLSISNIPAGATFMDNMDGTGTFDWTPDFTQAGLYYVTFKATDTAGAMAVDSEVVAITVIDSNSPPVIDAILPQFLWEGDDLLFNVYASDPEGDSIILSAYDLPPNAVFFDQYWGSGIFLFSPDCSQEGEYFVYITAFDGTSADTQQVSITVSPYSLCESVILKANFNDKVINAPIGIGGPTVGEPVYVDSPYITSFVRDFPMETPCLEITDTDDYYTGSVRFEFLDSMEVDSGMIAITADLWFGEFEDYNIGVREWGSSAQMFTNLAFRSDGIVKYSDKNSGYITIGSYAIDQVYSIKIVFDMNEGTYNIWLDSQIVLENETHGVTSAGIGRVFFAMGNDADYNGTLYVDNIKVQLLNSQTYIVTRLDDDEYEGSLRWAINMANDSTPASVDTIRFDPYLYGTIFLDSLLPPFTDSVGVVLLGDSSYSEKIIIDGSNITGSSAKGDMKNFDPNMLPTTYGLRFMKNYSDGAVANITFQNFDVGIWLIRCDGFEISNCVLRSCLYGIKLNGGPPANKIMGNEIYDNFVGIYTGYEPEDPSNGGSHWNKIGYNFIGTSSDYETDLGNGWGIFVQEEAGIYIFDNIIVENSIGITAHGWTDIKRNKLALTDCSGGGRPDLFNKFIGIEVLCPLGGIIGDDDYDGSGNYIGGGEKLIYLGETSHSNLIVNNILGKGYCYDSDGSLQIEHTSYGIHVDGSDGNTIGGNDFGRTYSLSELPEIFVENANNLSIVNNDLNHWTCSQLSIDINSSSNISVVGNDIQRGIMLTNSISIDINNNQIRGCFPLEVHLGTIILDGTSNCTIWQNHIYTLNGNGVYIAQNSSGNIIGPRNSIGHSGKNGIYIADADCLNNTITQNLIYDNDELGINLAGGVEDEYGVTENDDQIDPTGPNKLLDFPVITTANNGSSENFKNISGYARPNCTIELFFVNTNEDPSGHGEVRFFLAETTSDINGDFTFYNISKFAIVTATATDADGNTSEFSENYSLPDYIFTVTENESDGYGSLRVAINDANDYDGFAQIKFDITGTISLNTELPALSNPDGIFVDGRSAPDGPLSIILDGNGIITDPSANGLTIASNNSVCGLVIVNFPNDGIYIDQGSNNNIYDNYIGIESDGITSGGNGGNGINIGGSISTAADNNLIENNQISNNQNGIEGAYTSKTLITNNTIGRDDLSNDYGQNLGYGISISGSENTIFDNKIYGNSGSGINVESSTLTPTTHIEENKIIGNIEGMRLAGSGIIISKNEVSGNLGNGISLLHCPGADITGNTIGVNLDGSSPLPNTGHGISVKFSPNVTIGGENVDDQNVISNNSLSGIYVWNESIGNVITKNRIIGNDFGINITEGSYSNSVISNTITNNRKNVYISEMDTYRNVLLYNDIYGSTDGPDIDICPNGVNTEWINPCTPVDPSASNPPYYPVIDRVSDDCLEVIGPRNGRVYLYRVQKNGIDAQWCYTDGNEITFCHGGAADYFARSEVITSPDGKINICGLDFGISWPYYFRGYLLTALAIDEYGNTSEFSLNYSPNLLFAILLTCPVLVEIEDPLGRIINADSIGIPGAECDDVTDVDGDGDPDLQISLSGLLAGQYNFKVSPRIDALPEDTYTFRLIEGFDTTVIAQDVIVPPEGEFHEYTYIPDFVPTPTYTCGDANGTPPVNILDITYLINYLYKDGSPPVPECVGNGNGTPPVNILDITYLINYLYKGGPPPSYNCCG